MVSGAFGQNDNQRSISEEEAELVPPKVVKQVRPDYPYSMRRLGIAGEVVIGFIVDSSGNVREPYTIRSSDPGFREAAINAVRRWKFKPGVVSGKNVNTRMQVPIIFEIDGESVRSRWVVKRPRKFPESVPESMRWDEAPELEEFTSPVYPRDAYLERRKGDVKIAFLVGLNGRVEICKALEGDDPEMIGAAIAAVETFVFKPATKEGQPCGAVLNMKFEFRRSDSSDAPVTGSMKRLEKMLEKNPERIVRPSDLDSSLKPVYRSQPAIPWEYRESRESQRVMVEFIINRQGVAELPMAVGEYQPEFAHAAIQAVSRWQFEIPRRDGEPVDVRVRVPLVFVAKEPNS